MLCCVLLVSAADAQQYSYDGNRWYEIEVTVFSNENFRGEFREQALRETSSLAYLPRLRQLRPATASFQIDFDETPETGIRPEDRFTLPAPVEVEKGAAPAAGVPRSFRLDDFSRDPFIDLDERSVKFTQELTRLQNAPEHRVLWHAVWRQPMQGASQASSVMLIGGDRYAEHNELEGSIRFSDNNGRVNMDIQLWLNSFVFASDRRVRMENNRVLPEQPAAFVAEPGAPGNWTVAEVWQLKETRELRIADLYYLDNPAFGVLLQVRPYVLPVKSSGTSEEDF